MPAETCICFTHSSGSSKYICAEDVEPGAKILEVVGQPNENIDIKEEIKHFTLIHLIENSTKIAIFLENMTFRM